MPRAKYKEWEEEDKLEQIRCWIKDGLSDTQVAERIGVTKSLLSRWRQTRPKIRAAMVRLKLVDGKRIDTHDIAHGGRRKLDNVQELEQKINGWIDDCREHNTVMTKTSLCLCLNISKETLSKYLQSQADSTTVYRRSEIDGELHPVSVVSLLKRAVLAIEDDVVRRALSNKCNVAAAIFYLKNNHGYADKSEVSTVNTNVKSVSDEDIDKRIAELMDKSDVFRRSG